ncbi:hypothetical protein QJQ45_026501 [Haematococcus lacustris]|nr:hypothetical protein QJQ45_026501 [Haematococcus lacustris]
MVRSGGLRVTVITITTIIITVITIIAVIAIITIITIATLATLATILATITIATLWHRALCTLLLLQAYTAYLAELQAPAGSVPLLRCTTLVAQALRHPARQHSWVEAAMDRLARKVARQLPAAPAPRYPLKVLRTLLDVLYNQQGFRGQLPAMVPSDESSLIDQVLTHRGGTRLTLSLLVMEVARRLDLSLKPVQLPGCLLLALDLEGVEVLVDAFRGELLVPAEVADRVEGATGKPWRPQPGFIQARPPLPHHCGLTASCHTLPHFTLLVAHNVIHSAGSPAYSLRSQAGWVDPRRFLWLWLDELKQSYLDSHQMSQALCVVRLMRATLADQAGDLRDEGICLYALTRFAEAASALAAYLKVTPLAPDALLVWQLLEGCPSLQQQRHQVVQAAEEEDEQEQRVSTKEDEINSQDAEGARASTTTQRATKQKSNEHQPEQEQEELREQQEEQQQTRQHERQQRQGSSVWGGKSNNMNVQVAMAGNSNIGEKRLEEPKKECIASSKRGMSSRRQQQQQAVVHEQQCKDNSNSVAVHEQQQVVGVLWCMTNSKSSRL